jgi:hypothetical protein
MTETPLDAGPGRPDDETGWSLSGRKPGAGGGRLVGQTLGAVALADGTLLFAALWNASPAGAYSEVHRVEPGGARVLIASSERGARLAQRLYGFDRVEVGPLEWTLEAAATCIRWSEGGAGHVLEAQHPDHVGYGLITAVLRRLPDRWLLPSGAARLGARLLDRALDIGRASPCGLTRTGVPAHLLVRGLRPVLHPRYRSAASEPSGAVPYGGGRGHGELDFPRVPVLAQAELFFVPPVGWNDAR